ncbi:AbrB/MazE/SpoVT family DNA-binding domain-containing protein [Paenirhodobacter populi]|nr:hypothetical protein [Sinirhodobacter populi]
MIETRIRKVGNIAVMTLTAEMLTILDAKEGDTLFVVRGDDGRRSWRMIPRWPMPWPRRRWSWTGTAICFRLWRDTPGLGSSSRDRHHP